MGDQPSAMQILVAWRVNKWVVMRNAVEVGSYAYRVHAMDRARSLSAEAVELGLDCYMLVRDEDGVWDERPCPKAVSRPTPDAG